MWDEVVQGTVYGLSVYKGRMVRNVAYVRQGNSLGVYGECVSAHTFVAAVLLLIAAVVDAIESMECRAKLF